MTKITILILLTLSSSVIANDNVQSNSKYNCIEINKLTANKAKANTRALKRASRIPKNVLADIQTFMVDEVDLDENGLQALDPNEGKCENDATSLVLGGVVTDYKKGNRVVRYMVGFGAGKQKIESILTLKDKLTGEVLAQGRVVDRKIGGLVGGSDDKGKRDFAEKVNNFIRNGIGLKKTTKR